MKTYEGISETDVGNTRLIRFFNFFLRLQETCGKYEGMCGKYEGLCGEYEEMCGKMKEYVGDMKEHVENMKKYGKIPSFSPIKALGLRKKKSFQSSLLKLSTNSEKTL